MRAALVTNGLAQPMFFGGMSRVHGLLCKRAPTDFAIKFAKWSQMDGILAWLDELGSSLEYVNMLGYSYGGSTNGFAAKARPGLQVKNFVGVDIVWRPAPYRVSAKSLEENHAIDLTQTGIRNVTLWRQQRGKITGHGVQIDGGVTLDQTIVWDGEHMGPSFIPHLRIDDQEEIIERCVSLLLE